MDKDLSDKIVLMQSKCPEYIDFLFAQITGLKDDLEAFTSDKQSG